MTAINQEVRAAQAGHVHATIARVRRAMPRNADVMALCDRLEELERPAVKAVDPDRAAVKREQARLRMQRWRAKKPKRVK